MRTLSGKFIDLANPQPDTICLGDLIQAAAREGRFANQCDKIYTVAEHSVLVSHLVLEKEAKALGLAHDLTEALIRDVPRPFKTLVPTYKKFEDKLLQVILKRFKIKCTPKLWSLVKIADLEAYNIERIAFFNDNSLTERQKCAKIIKSLGWTPGLSRKAAEKLFWSRWKELKICE